MALYSYLCSAGHRTERYEHMVDHTSDRIPCDRCMDWAQQEILPHNTAGGQISDATRKILEVPFGRKAVRDMTYTKDISAHIAKIEKQYGMKGLDSNAS